MQLENVFCVRTIHKYNVANLKSHVCMKQSNETQKEHQSLVGSA